ncbi:MAG: 30S ribosomal protein S2 [Gemmatimonadales bacterium]|jgi:small subunit ribosomal protein S2
MADPKLQELLEAGVHFGHQTRRWNPKMRRFIFAERSGIYLIDLQKTLNQLRAAQDLLRQVVMSGDNVLFVCTKKQLNTIVRTEAERAGAHWVTERWLGGTLTNFQTIRRQIRRLKELEQGQDEGAFEFFTKKEQLHFDRERQKLERNLQGIKNMSRLPGVVFVVDAKKERIAIAEANKLGIPVVAIVDTNADPDLISVPIPGNDDAIRSVSVITSALVDVIAQARKEAPTREVAGDSEAYSTYSAEGTEAGEEETRRRRPRRKRRPKPEAIAARLKREEAAKEKKAEAETAGAATSEAAATRTTPKAPTPADEKRAADDAKSPPSKKAEPEAKPTKRKAAKKKPQSAAQAAAGTPPADKTSAKGKDDA